jgi:hypothetical protein
MLHKCSQCNYITDIKCNLKRHQSRIHKDEQISNAIIASGGVKIANEAEKISKNDEIQIDTFQCNKCSQIYGNQNALNIHISTCKTILSLQCNKCTNMFSNNKTFKTHTLICKDVKNALECPNCHQIFTSKQSKSYHLNNCKIKIADNRDLLIPNQCGICTKSFASKRNLEYHLNICKGVKNSLECHICHRIFNSHSAKSFHLKNCKHIIEEKESISSTNNNDIQYKKKSMPQSLRISVWDTYIGRSIGETKCSVCNNNNISQFDFHCGHIIAEKNGGTTCISNLRPICKSCNCSMRTYNLEEYKQRYFKNQ